MFKKLKTWTNSIKISYIQKSGGLAEEEFSTEY
jgi:hypothetical protein